MGYEPLRTLVDKLISQVACNLPSGVRFSRNGGSFSYNNQLFYVDLWFNGTWKVEIRKYLVRGFNPDVYYFQVNLDDPLMFEKLEKFIGV